MFLTISSCDDHGTSSEQVDEINNDFTHLSNIIRNAAKLEESSNEELIKLVELEYSQDYNEILGEFSNFNSFRSLQSARLSEDNPSLDFGQLVEDMNMSQLGNSYLERIQNLFDESIDGDTENSPRNKPQHTVN